MKALKASVAGDTIMLSAGNYSALNLSGIKFAGAGVTIQSADASNMAKLSGLAIQNSSGLTFKSLDLSTSGGWATYMTRVSDINFVGSKFHGAAKGDGDAMMIRDSSKVTITASDFGNLSTGINQLNSSNITISSNKFHDITSGAIRGSGVTNETITGNAFLDASATNTTHSDVIALWQDNTANKVVISDNTYGATSPTTTTPTEPVTTTPPPTTTSPTAPVSTTPPATSAPIVEPATHVYSVSTTDQLLATLKKAVAGDVIQLAQGAYGTVNLAGFNFSGAGVTIQSADASQMAVVNGLNISDSSNIIIKALDLSASTTGWGASMVRATNVTFTGDKFHGAAIGDGGAMMIRDSSGVVITGSDFRNLDTGINQLNSSNLVISNNVFDDIKNGVIRGSGVTNEQVSGNTFVDASATNLTHSDVIILWQDNTANNVTFTDNVYGSGTAPVTDATATAPTAPTTTAPTTTTPTTGGSTAVAAEGGTIYTVTSTSEFLAAAKKAVNGDTIQLAPGTYSGAALVNLNVDGNVTITSATATKAVLSGFGVSWSSGFTLKNLEFTKPASGIAIGVGNSSDIVFDRIDVHGDGGTYEGLGMQVRSSTGVTIQNSEFHNLGAGISSLLSDDILVSGSAFHNVATDGVLGAGVQHMTVKDNTFTNFRTPDGAHPDAIQFFSYGGVTTSDILVLGNKITRGDGTIIQGIFFEDTKDAVVSGNSMVGTMYNGISVSRGANFMISNNFLQGYSDMSTRIIVRGASSDVTVAHNTTQQIIDYADGGTPNPNFLQIDNTIIGDAPVGDLTTMNAWLAKHVGLTTTILGGEGNDLLTGTVAADTMAGGFGDDLYQVGAGDVVSEASLAGVDTVKTALANYTLGANVENLVLTGTAAQVGTGNALANTLVSNTVGARLDGGAGNDVLISLGGADTLTGGAGADTFRFVALTGATAQITDFTRGADKLDLHNLLPVYAGTDPVADKLLKLVSDASGTTVYVDLDGAGATYGMVAVAKLAGVATLTSADWII